MTNANSRWDAINLEKIDEIKWHFLNNVRFSLSNFRRFETHNGTFLTSPNQILKPYNQEKFKDIPEFVLNLARKLGEDAHEALQKIAFSINQRVDMPPKSIELAQKVFDFLAEKGFKILESEIAVLNLPEKYYGVIDLIGINKKNELVIIEFKTRSKLKSEDDWLSEKLQLFLYKKAVETLNIKVKAYLLVANRNKTGEIFFEELKINKTQKKILKNLQDFNKNLQDLKKGEK